MGSLSQPCTVLLRMLYHFSKFKESLLIFNDVLKKNMRQGHYSFCEECAACTHAKMTPPANRTWKSEPMSKTGIAWGLSCVDQIGTGTGARNALVIVDKKTRYVVA